MIKSELIEILAIKHSHFPLSDVESAVKIMLEHMTQSLASGERVEIRGFGSFNLNYHAPIMVEILRQVKQSQYPKNIRLILKLEKNSEKELIIHLVVFSE